MTTLTTDKVPKTAESPEVPSVLQVTRLHTGPVARLLSMVSKWNGEYVDYQMETGTWRKLAL